MTNSCLVFHRHFVIAGLDPAIRESGVDSLIQIQPIGVVLLDQRQFPGARPVLDVLLALQGVPDVVEFLVVDQSVDTISLCETIGRALPVLPSSAREIVRHADVQGAVPSTGQDVDVVGHLCCMPAVRPAGLSL